MAKFIEQAIDAWMTNFFTTQMGAESSYDTLRLEEIKLANPRSQVDWADWTLPALAFSTRLAFRRPAGHGLGKLRLYRAIPYTLTFVTLGNEQAEARDMVLELIARAETAFSNITSSDINGAITTDSGERFRRICYYANEEAGATDVERAAGMSRTRFYKNNNNGTVWGVGDYTVVFLTTTGG